MSEHKKKQTKTSGSKTYFYSQAAFERLLKNVQSKVYQLDDEKLNASFQNPREVERDKAVTNLLSSYVDAYKNRQTDNRSFRKQMFRLCKLSVYGLILTIIGSIVYLLVWTERSVTDIVALVTACVSAIGSIAFLLEIVAKYVFPSNEEDHIAHMVQAVQKNDLDERKLRYDYQKTLKFPDPENVSTKNEDGVEEKAAGA